MRSIPIIALLTASLAAASAFRLADPDCGPAEREDCTSALRSLLARREDTLILAPRPGGYPVRPLDLRRGRVTLVLEPGAELRAMPGGFPSRKDCLFSMRGLDDVAIIGPGARLVMRKGEYATGEWRHAVSMLGCRRVRIEGLRIDSSGGDGIYIGSWTSAGRPASESILIRDCALTGHRRQGISVISAKGLRVERSMIRGTSGTAPECGLDFEPNEPWESLEDCSIADCVFADNANHAAMAWLGKLRAGPGRVSIRFDRCRFDSSRRGSGFHLGGFRDKRIEGEIRFRACVFQGNAVSGVDISDLPVGEFRVRLDSCRVRNSARAAVTFVRDEATWPLGGLVAHALSVDSFLRSRVVRAVPEAQALEAMDVRLAEPAITR